MFLTEDRFSTYSPLPAQTRWMQSPCVSLWTKKVKHDVRYFQVVKLFLLFVKVCFMMIYVFSYPSHNLTGSEYPWCHRREWMPRAALSHPPPPRDPLRKTKHIPIILIFHVKNSLTVQFKLIFHLLPLSWLQLITGIASLNMHEAVGLN